MASLNNRSSIAVVVLAIAALAVLLFWQSDQTANPTALEGDTESLTSISMEKESATPVLNPMREFVEAEPVSIMDLAGTQEGESFSLYIPQEDRIVAGTVEISRVTKSGNEVLEGRIKDGDQSYGFVVTIGRYQTFGSVQTSRDRYQFELTDGEGELIAQSAINKIRAFSEPDYVIPQRSEPERINEN